MLEEKELNGQDSLDVNVTSSEVNNDVVTDNDSKSVDMSYSTPLQNAFLYMDSAIYPSVETQVESLDVREQNNQNLDQESNSMNVNEELVVDKNLNLESFSLDDSIDNVNGDVVTEVPVSQNESVKVENKNSESQSQEVMESDLKSNLIFIIVFAIIMLGVIFALPYISGYN